LFEEAELYFADAAGLDAFETVDGDHGRIETRRHAVSTDIAWLRADRAAPGEHTMVLARSRRGLHLSIGLSRLCCVGSPAMVVARSAMIGVVPMT
jgi:hypothetical protein